MAMLISGKKIVTTVFVSAIFFGSSLAAEELPFKPGLKILPGEDVQTINLGAARGVEVDIPESEVTRSFTAKSDTTTTNSVAAIDVLPAKSTVSVPMKSQAEKSYSLKLQVTPKKRRAVKKSRKLRKVASRSLKRRSVHVPTPMLIGVFR